MAGGGSVPTLSGRRKNLDAEINLVPFIDLLSMCICFLLMTAIWVEISSIPIKQILGTEAQASTAESIDLQVTVHSDKSLIVQLERGGKILQTLTLNAGAFEQTLSSLSQYIGQVMSSLPVSQSGVTPDITARIVPSYIKYFELVQILDILRGYGISHLAVVPIRE